MSADAPDVVTPVTAHCTVASAAGASLMLTVKSTVPAALSSVCSPSTAVRASEKLLANAMANTVPDADCATVRSWLWVTVASA